MNEIYVNEVHCSGKQRDRAKPSNAARSGIPRPRPNPINPELSRFKTGICTEEKQNDRSMIRIFKSSREKKRTCHGNGFLSCGCSCRSCRCCRSSNFRNIK